MARLPIKKGNSRFGTKRSTKEVDQERVKQQKLYYYEKQLHKVRLYHKREAVKKAREFEIRKVSRRLKQALNSEAKDGHTASTQAAVGAQKFQHQLEAAKALRLDDLAKQAVNSIVRNEEQTAAPQQQEQPPQQESQTEVLVRARILSAKCVQETLEVARQALARVEAAAAQLPATHAQSTSEPEKTALDSPTGKLRSDDGSCDAAHASASAGGDAYEGRPEDVIEATSSSAHELSEDAEELAAKRRKLLGSDGEGDTRAGSQKKQPKPPPPRRRKNRLGQRARKLLAGTPQHGHPPLKNSRPGQLVSPAGQPGGRMGRSAVRTGPVKQARAAASNPGGAPSLTKEPFVKSHHAKPGQAKEGEQEQLHPSWAAKKALADKAGLMTRPQGTKVIFDVDD